MKILITNLILNNRTGTELYVRDLALSLLKRGHSPVVYSPQPGKLADEIRQATIPVVDDLNNISFVPDIIHGHHLYETVTALLKYPDTPALFVCHDWSAWHDVPPKFSRVRRYIAVDETCLDRLICENSIPVAKTNVLLNFVDTDRFQKRVALPEKPARALIFSNYAQEDSYIRPIREACIVSGIELDVIGSGVGKQTNIPEKLLGQYDLVFAKAKAAIEAMAVGAAVILCDANGLGGMVDMSNVRQLRQLNFGRRALSEKIHMQAILEEIAKYDARDADNVSQFIRANADIRDTVTSLINIYEEVIDEQKSSQEVERDREYGEIHAFFCSIKPGLLDLRSAARSDLSQPVLPTIKQCVISAMVKIGVYERIRKLYRVIRS